MNVKDCMLATLHRGQGQLVINLAQANVILCGYTDARLVEPYAAVVTTYGPHCRVRFPFARTPTVPTVIDRVRARIKLDIPTKYNQYTYPGTATRVSTPICHMCHTSLLELITSPHYPEWQDHRRGHSPHPPHATEPQQPKRTWS